MLISGAKLRLIECRRQEGGLPGSGVRIEDGETVDEACSRLGRSGLSRRKALDAIGGEVAAGRLDVEWEPHSADLRAVAGGGPDAERVCVEKPHLWNLLAYEREWDQFPEYNDFLNANSPVYNKKNFQWEIYASLLKDELGLLKPGSRVLDNGGGVGRAAVRLAERGCDVTVADASPQALKAAWGHLTETGAGAYDLVWAEAAKLDFIESGSMDAALALEVFCYIADPEEALRETVRCVRPGGWVAFSVENKPGAMLSDPRLKSLKSKLRVKDDVLLVENEIFVRYFTKRKIKIIARAAGLESVRVAGCHFIADGIFDFLAKERDYERTESRERFHNIERFLCHSPVEQLARAWLAVGRVKR